VEESSVIPSPAVSEQAGESKKEAITFRIPGLPPSVNSLYQIIYAQKRVELRPEARLWKSKGKQYVPCWKTEKMEPLGIELEFYGNWFFKNAAFRKLDLQNLIKLVCDTVAEKCGFDDSQFFKFEAKKVQSEEEYVKVTLKKL